MIAEQSRTGGKKFGKKPGVNKRPHTLPWDYCTYDDSLGWKCTDMGIGGETFLISSSNV
jgi:hypothetical protein